MLRVFASRVRSSAHVQPLRVQRLQCQLERTRQTGLCRPFAASAPGNPLQMFEQLQEVVQKVGAQAGLPKSPEELQAKLNELKASIEATGPAMGPVADLGAALEGNSEKVVKVAFPFVTATAILLRARNQLTEEQELKLREVLPDPAIKAIKEMIPLMPVDPQLEMFQALMRKLEALELEVQSLKAAVSQASVSPAAKAAAAPAAKAAAAPAAKAATAPAEPAKDESPPADAKK
eukprot:TRINITY_DN10558_c0_g1_i1.p1 TRINITY_DN10558_c0_g1~~TRINITY_DN10558_c0_g1_i1.p1  ORF type:complete len:234 (+),score=54.80 TRINITY_DN10558_c0_g1_i1:64-765(+)